jgi:hypothetical protein
MNDYRCETCKNADCKHFPKTLAFDASCGDSYLARDPIHAFTKEYGCASHSNYKKITFDSMANEIRLTDAGFVKCDFGSECDICEKHNDELYTCLDWETGEADSYRCPDCAFKELDDTRSRDLQLSWEMDKERDENLRKSERSDILTRLHPLFECIKKHWNEHHEAPVYQYNNLEKTLNDFEETLRNPELDERENSIISEIICFACNDKERTHDWETCKTCDLLKKAKERFRGYV